MAPLWFCLINIYCAWNCASFTISELAKSWIAPPRSFSQPFNQACGSPGLERQWDGAPVPSQVEARPPLPMSCSLPTAEAVTILNLALVIHCWDQSAFSLSCCLFTFKTSSWGRVGKMKRKSFWLEVFFFFFFLIRLPYSLKLGEMRPQQWGCLHMQLFPLGLGGGCPPLSPNWPIQGKFHFLPQLIASTIQDSEDCPDSNPSNVSQCHLKGKPLWSRRWFSKVVAFTRTRRGW